MNHRLHHVASIVLMISMFTATGVAAEEASKPSAAEQSRRMLNEGYSLLRRDMSRAQHADLILLVKSETDAVNTLVKAISNYSEQVTNRLDSLAAQYPAMRVDLEPLPEMEVRKRFSIGKDRAKDFLPFVGVSQHEFERTMLISLSNALNHERHLCRVMAKEEPQPELKKFLVETEKGFEKLFVQTMELLERDYFIADPKQN